MQDLSLFLAPHALQISGISARKKGVKLRRKQDGWNFTHMPKMHATMQSTQNNMLAKRDHQWQEYDAPNVTSLKYHYLGFCSAHLNEIW